MITLLRTDSSNPEFIQLVRELDHFLKVIDGEDHAFYDQYNGTADLKQVVLAFSAEKAVGCGAIKPYLTGVMEVKRMYTSAAYRGRGVAGRILSELECWAKELGCNNCILETGNKQEAAIALYEKSGYRRIPNFGQYQGISNSICFEKKI